MVRLRPPSTLVYLAARDPAADWSWPEPEEPPPDSALIFSWAMILDELGGGRCRLLLRLRMKRVGHRMSPPFRAFAGLVDYVTIALMAAGLRERLWVEQGPAQEPATVQAPYAGSPGAQARPRSVCPAVASTVFRCLSDSPIVAT